MSLKTKGRAIDMDKTGLFCSKVDRIAGKFKKLFAGLMDHFLVSLLIMSLIVLTLGGVGNALIAGSAGVALCLAGCMQGAVTVDLRVLIPLLVFDMFSMLSSWHTYGSIARGFAPTHLVLTALYLLMAHLEDRERLLLRRLCILWTGGVAVQGILQFTLRTQTTDVGRLSGLLGNPNALGIFLVVGWFALLAENRESSKLDRLEPVILAALAMTLSMGSFLAMAGGTLIFFLVDRRRVGMRQRLLRICQVIARATVSMGIGLLLYIAGRKTNVRWLCILLIVYLLIVVIDWKNICALIQKYPRMAGLLAVAGIFVAGIAVALRPSAAATFVERLSMMRSGLRYIMENPLLGVGPYQWRRLDYNDGGIYFNTWHIHNLFLHIGVELGLVAMAALIAVTLRHFLKNGEPAEKAGSAAFLFHCMVDTGFFYEAVPALTLLTVSRPQKEGRQLGTALSRTIFGLLGTVFIWNLLHLRV